MLPKLSNNFLNMKTKKQKLKKEIIELVKYVSELSFAAIYKYNPADKTTTLLPKMEEKIDKILRN